MPSTLHVWPFRCVSPPYLSLATIQAFVTEMTAGIACPKARGRIEAFIDKLVPEAAQRAVRFDYSSI